MIARPLTRRAVMAGGLLGAAALSGCSVSDLTERKVSDPEASDRARLEQAHDLSAQLQGDIDASLTQNPALPHVFAEIRSLHVQQIAEFDRSGGLRARERSTNLNPGPLPVTLKELVAREGQLAQSLRSLALHAQRGEVAALLASAAAGIDQVVAR